MSRLPVAALCCQAAADSASDWCSGARGEHVSSAIALAGPSATSCAAMELLGVKNFEYEIFPSFDLWLWLSEYVSLPSLYIGFVLEYLSLLILSRCCGALVLGSFACATLLEGSSAVILDELWHISMLVLSCCHDVFS